MRLLRISALAFVFALVLAACGSSDSNTKSTATTNGSTATTAAGAASGVAINSAQTSLGTVLVNGEGRTLYHFTKDTATTIACVDKCAVTWPPVTVPSGQQPKAGSGVTGALTVVNRPDGTQQVAVNGQPVYMYSGDTKAGDTNGQGVGGIWFALTASGSSIATTAGTPTTTAHPTTTAASSGGGGY
jgi:predicted lipoprotein with Yx(FWY)xxD motif